jgi:hypothetical protein
VTKIFVTQEQLANIATAYRVMAREARYRPAAPSDGMGNITEPLDQLDLDSEALCYAREWLIEEEEGTFWIGCTDFTLAPATVYAIEAARNLCAGLLGRVTAKRLLIMALAELDDDAPTPRKARTPAGTSRR